MEVYKLDAIYRQAESSPIVQNAIRINNGITDLVCNDDFKIYRYTYNQNEHVAAKAVSILVNNLGYETANPFKSQILSPIKKELVGVNNINRVAQQTLNGSKEKGRLKVNDKVIFTVNNYTEGYFNGDIGIIKDISENHYQISLQGEDLEIPKECDEDIQLAYAITIHKSQGSEYENAVIVLPKNGILKRNLIYTAITRAKKSVIILSEEDALEQAILRDVKDKRNSGLLDFWKV